MKRRHFLSSLLALGAAGCARPEVDRPAASGSLGTDTSTSEPTTSTTLPSVEPLDAPDVVLPPTAFALGVASGDPADRSVALWTRLMADDLPDAFGIVWELALDPEFSTLVATDIIDVGIGFGHTAHVVAEGLEPESTYWYRFRAGTLTSPAGRTRTLASPGTMPDRLRVGATCCQLRDAAEYAALRDIAEAELDLVVFLGDFIYSRSSSSPLSGREHQSADPTDLAGYRARYAEYRADPVLQAASAAHPWLITWDDHEVVNDYDATVDPTRRRAAYQAWWEHQPTRLSAPGTGDFDVYRSIDAGDLARVIAIDCRQHADGSTILGDRQKAWLADQLADVPGWTILGSSVLVGGILVPFDDEVLLPYTWDGYPDDRAWLAAELSRQPRRICLSGDLHLGAALEVSADPANRDAPPVATEFMAPAVSSGFPEAYADVLPLVPLANLHIHHLDAANGWLRLEVTPGEATAEFRTVDDVTTANSPVTTAARFSVVPGDPRPQPA